MTSSLYISTTEAGSGKALISLGIIELILRKTNKVAFFRPVIRKQPLGKTDEDINLIKHKGATPELACEYLLDVSYFGTMMVY